MKLEDRLKLFRTSHNLTQSQVANALQIKQYNLSDYETGRAKPDIDTLIKFADLYEVSIDDLLSHTPNLPGKTSTATPFNEYLNNLHALKILRRIQPLTDQEMDQLYNIIDSTCKTIFKK